MEWGEQARVQYRVKIVIIISLTFPWYFSDFGIRVPRCPLFPPNYSVDGRVLLTGPQIDNMFKKMHQTPDAKLCTLEAWAVAVRNMRRPGEVLLILALFVLFGTLHGTRAQHDNYDNYNITGDSESISIHESLVCRCFTGSEPSNKWSDDVTKFPRELFYIFYSICI